MALLIGAAWHEAFGAGWPGIGAAAVVVVAAAVVWTPEPAYPQEDVRSRIEAIEAPADEDDVILVYPASRWAYALYSTSDPEFYRSDLDATGFDVRITDPRVHVLSRPSIEPGRWETEVGEVTADATRVWFVSSHVGPDNREAVERLLVEEGFEPVVGELPPDGAGGWASLWERSP